MCRIGIENSTNWDDDVPKSDRTSNKETNWDVDDVDGADETETMEFMFEQVATEDAAAGVLHTESPGKTKYWVPTCDDAMKPIVGMQFKTVEDGIKFYSDYSAKVRFDVRKGASRMDTKSKTIMHRYMLCNRSGFRKTGRSSGKRKPKLAFVH